MVEYLLGAIAHGRSGDKGNHANVAAIAYTPAGYGWLRENLTADRVAAYFARLSPSRVVRCEAPNLLALNFILYDVLAGGASRSLRIDTQGKTLALSLLEMSVGLPEKPCRDAAASRKELVMNEPLALYDLRPPAAIITLNRPDRRNAISRGLIAALHDVFLRAANDAEARCVILTGAGSVFCAGMDLAELAESLNQGVAPNRVWDDALRLATLYDVIYGLPKPTIAAVNGAAVAGGAGLVTVCDLAVASTEARFGYPEVRRGLVAAMVMPHLLRHVGERMARYLLLTGELIGPEEAIRSGLINAVSAAGDVMTTALAWGRSLAEGSRRR